MGQALLRLAPDDPRIEVVAAVSRSVGQRVIDRVPRFSSAELGGVPAFDVAVDFSLPEGLDTVLSGCLQAGRALVRAGVFADVTWIQRLATENGLAPTTGCDDAHVGAAVLAPYDADYFFYRPSSDGERIRQCAAR